ncbi:MAG TPA: hypothetical protein DHU79_08865 [Clostridiales bacterium]|uniref:hypothetical protein n=1 Tax=Candidatus Fimenecus sp. TaxID=3022888 RepID=UPI000EE8B8E9|nr:hypothetical protein [Clostridiales bacterium]
MFRNDRTNNQVDNTDVYAGVMHPYFSQDPSFNQGQSAGNDVYANLGMPSAAVGTQTQQQTDAGEFNLESIQKRLGNVDTTSEMAVGTTPDVMPSSTTLNMAYQRNYANDEQTAVRSKVSTRTKVIAVSYVAVVLALVLAVTLCAVSVGTTFATYSGLDAAYNTAVSDSSALDGMIETENANSDQLFKRATELGYVDAAETNVHYYQRLETRPAQNFQVESNWFDALCDWLSGVFGG